LLTDNCFTFYSLLMSCYYQTMQYVHVRASITGTSIFWQNTFISWVDILSLYSILHQPHPKLKNQAWLTMVPVHCTLLVASVGAMCFYINSSSMLWCAAQQSRECLNVKIYKSRNLLEEAQTLICIFSKDHNRYWLKEHWWFCPNL